QVEQPETADLPAEVAEELPDMAGDQPGADDPDPLGPPPTGEPLRAEHRRTGCPARRDDRGLQAGKGKSGAAVVEHQGRRGPRDAVPRVVREARDPLETGHVELAAEVGRQGDDPGPGQVREAQETAVRVDAVPLV